MNSAFVLLSELCSDELLTPKVLQIQVQSRFAKLRAQCIALTPTELEAAVIFHRLELPLSCSLRSLPYPLHQRFLRGMAELASASNTFGVKA